MFGLSDTPAGSDILDLLKRDHRQVDEMFEEYETLKGDGAGRSKAELAARICEALTVHAAVEEEIFYPAVRKADAGIHDLISEAAVEHQSLKDIIGRLQAAPVTDPLYDAGVKVLGEYVKHHVKEEENELFPRVRRIDLNREALGQKVLERKAELERKARTPDATRNGGARRAMART